jgi:alpha-L-fucosidase
VPLSRRNFLAASAAAAASTLLTRNIIAAQPARPRPTASQLLWQRDELALFLHFGVNTFTDREWGDGKEDPAIFAPTDLDANQWAITARDAGFKTLVLTAKHHDGFCLWPTATTKHSVASSPWRNGRGDVVREMVDACRRHGLRVGLYCSPWDRNHATYGDSDRYNTIFRQQLTELLGNYGEIHEVWFDGANGEGPNGKRQVYDWPRTFAHVRQLQPNAVIFSDAGPDVRWIGNERGVAGETNWSTIRSSAVPYPGVSGDGIIEALQHGHADGDVWRPGETDVSIRPGWFYHPAEDARVKSVNDLVAIYFSSVGRNSKLLLNVPPTREGKIHAVDAARLKGMHEALSTMLGDSVRARLRDARWQTSSRTAMLTATVDAQAPVSIIDLREGIESGQRVSQWVCEIDAGSGWTEVARGVTIGYRALRRITPIAAKQVRVRITDSIETPLPIALNLYSPTT